MSGKLKSDVNGRPRCEPIKFTTSVICKNVAKHFVAIALFVKKSTILLRGAKCN